jgi:chromosome segregation ATPase
MQRASSVTGEALASVGGLLAGLRAKLDGLQRRRAQEVASEQAAATHKAERERAAQQAAAMADVKARQEALTARLATWAARLLALDTEAAAVWVDFEAIQQAIEVLASDAAHLGTDAAVTLTQTPEVERIQRGHGNVRWLGRARR